MRKMVLFAMLLLLLPTGAATADWGWGDSRVKETETFERTVSFAATGRLNIATVNGSIEVETWNRDEVEIHATKEAQARDRETALELLAETEVVIDEGRDLEIRVERPETSWRGRRRGGVSVSFKLMVPRAATLDAQTTNGNISVVGLDGDAEVRTTNGAVDVRDIGGRAEIATTNGSIRARGIRGHLAGRTTNGSIDAELAANSLAEDLKLTTTNGSVDLTVSSGLSASIVARANNGRVRSDLDARLVAQRRGYLELELGGGGPQIDIRTTNGRVTLRDGR